MQIIQFAFIPAVSLAIVAAVLVGLFAVGALFDALEHPDELGGRIEAAFRQRPVAGRIAGRDHYYKPYWEDR